jgi:osmotically inducible protein OsmC
MAIRKAKAQWNGTLKEGNGTMNFSNYSGPFTFVSRFEEGEGTNPEELVGAAQAGCYSMFLSALISGENLSPESIETTATVTLGSDDTGRQP